MYKKAKVNFKILDVTDSETNNYYTHIAQFLQPNDEIWSKFRCLITFTY